MFTNNLKLDGIENILGDIGYMEEMKGAGEDQEDKYTKKSGKKSKDYDGDGTVEDETDEYAGVKDRAIKKATGKCSKCDKEPCECEDTKKETKEETKVDFSTVLDELTDEEVLFLSDTLIEEVVEEFFYETLEEGFEIDELETILIEQLETELTYLDEAKVTVGHDSNSEVSRPSRLAKVKDAVKKVASGAKAVAKKVAGAAGEVAGSAVAGYKKASAAGADAPGGKERDDSTNDSPKTGSKTATGTKRPGLLGRIASGLKSGLKKAIHGAGKVAGKVVKTAKAGYDEGRGKETKSAPAAKPAAKKPAAKQATPAAKTATAKKKAGGNLDNLLKQIRSEAKMSAPETAEKERIVRGMKKNTGEFMNRYPDKWKNVMYATATKLAKEEMELELDEAMTSYERNRQRAAQRAAARNAARDAGQTGAVKGVGYVTPRRERETWTDESGKERHKTGARMPQKEEYMDEAGKLQGGGKDPCWKGYEMVGMKNKSGKEVPNCVPKEEYEELVMDMIEEGYEMDQVREVIAAYEDGYEVIFEENGVLINDEVEQLDEEVEFLSDVEAVADWLHTEGIIENEDEFFELMEDLSEDEIQELYDVVFEATAMAKRGHDEAEIRNKIAANTKGGKSADRATALADKQTFKGDGSARDKYARAQRGDHRKTTSSNPGLHGYAHKSDDPKVKAKQAARGAQRGSATLTPNERKKLNMGYEVIGDSLENGGLEVQTIQEISADLALRTSREADKKRGKLAHSGDKEGAMKKMSQASRLYKKQAAKRLGRNEDVEMIGDSLEEGGLEVRNYSWREVLEAQEARNNPEKYEAGQKKKSAPVRGEKTPMPPRGDKRREDFEKWYAANVR
jgi:hypothetical protein